MASILAEWIRAMREAGFQLNAEDIADILWLALRQPPAPMPEEELPAPETSEETERPTLPITEIGQRVEPKPTPLVTEKETAKPNAMEPAPVEKETALTSRSGSQGERSLPFATPSGETLPGKLDYTRALRPLTRRVPSLYHFAIDEEATVQRIVEEDIWIPVLRPEQTRWLELDVVVDESPSMHITYDVVREMLGLLEHLGAFTSMQVWGLVDEPIRTPIDSANTSNEMIDQMARLRIHPGFGPGSDAQKQSRSPGEMISSRGSGLVIVISDCTAPAWYDGRAGKLLAGWGEHDMVLLVNTLPRDMWLRTGLMNAVAISAQYWQPGASNCNLEPRFNASMKDWANREKKENPGGFFALPAAALDPKMLGQWAKALTSRSGLSVTGYWVPTTAAMEKRRIDSDKKLGRDPVETLGALDRLLRYMAIATPMALRLAGYLAAIPLSLPVMRLVQRAVLPESGPEHLAEFILGGLVTRRLPESSPTPSSAKRTAGASPAARQPALQIEYDFFQDTDRIPPGERFDIRAALLDRLTVDERTQVWQPVADYIRQHAGQVDMFEAYLTNPAFARPFALLGSEALRNLGGAYAELAGDIWRAIKPVKETAPGQAPVPGPQTIRVQTTAPRSETVEPPVEQQAAPQAAVTSEALAEEPQPPEASASVISANLVIRLQPVEPPDEKRCLLTCHLNIAQIFLGEIDLERLQKIDYRPPAKSYGQRLGKILFANPQAASALPLAQSTARRNNVPLRVQIWIEPILEKLQSIYWETLSGPDTPLPLVFDEDTYFSRTVQASFPPVEIAPRDHLSALVFIANPSNPGQYNLATIDAEIEKQRLVQSLSEINTEVVSGGNAVTLENMAKALHGTREIDIVCIAAHGLADRSGEYALFFEDNEGKATRTTAALLIQAISGAEKMPRLVVLIEPQGAGQFERKSILSLAAQLVEGGIPAVLAFAAPLPAQSQEKFLARFFQNLQQGLELDRAVGLARREMALMEPEIGWWSPVLCTSQPDARLRVLEKPAPPAKEEELLYFNGVNGNNGMYLLPPMTVKQLSDAILGVLPDDETRELNDWYKYRGVVNF